MCGPVAGQSELLGECDIFNVPTTEHAESLGSWHISLSLRARQHLKFLLSHVNREEALSDIECDNGTDPG